MAKFTPAKNFSDPEEASEGIFKRLSLGSMFHVLWLRKWIWLGVWIVLAAPAGVLLSIFDLPKSYTSATVMRFPNVIGAQTNVMRDVAVASRESIVSIFKSYGVLEATATRMKLRLGIKTKDTFQRYYFSAVDYSDSLELGTYTLHLLGERQAKIQFKARGGSEVYTLFQGGIPPDNTIKADGLVLTLAPKAASRLGEKTIKMEFVSMDEAVQSLRKGLVIKPLGATNIEASLKDRDPWLVSDVLNVLREEFLRTYYGTTEVQEVGVVAQMEKDLEAAKIKLERSEDDLGKFYIIHPELSARADFSPLDNMALMESRSETNVLQSRIDRLRTTMAAKPPDSDAEQKVFWAYELLGVMVEAGEPKASILRAGLQEQRAKEAALAGQVGPEHPRLLEVQQKKIEIYAAVESAQVALAARLATQKKETQGKVVKLSSEAGMRPSVKVELELERLTSVNTNNQVIYDRVLEAYNRAKLLTGSEFFKVAIVDEARPAPYISPSFQTRIAIAGAAVLALLILVPMAFLGWHVLLPRVWSKDDVYRQLGLRTLGVVVQRNVPKGKRGESRPRANNGGADGRDRTVDPLLLFFGKASQIEDVEAFRIIREEVENSFKNPARPGKYCIMVTSSHPHEGKSTCASNLAMTFARKGKRTLLVDADFRLGRIDRIFNLNVETGIDDILSQVDLSLSQFSEIAPMAYLPTMQRDLVVAPRKNPNANAGEMVSSDRFKHFIQMAKDQFDVVIIDTPPVMITPEPLSLVELVDGIAFVCRSGVTITSEAMEAVGILKDRNIRVEALLNGVKDTPFVSNRYKKYSYYYQVPPMPGKPPIQGE